ncbi:gastric intrinsic factor-like protein 2 [Plakobranchus ocellatus]|uniref:Gastric intrinsic factor-like protein 2 n=1 Tax=Plakobranchus ocellatus TaxID=259542 RepID=A0AAV3XZV8_9GAST|nr:gastric intrinsic factor-like protein 2 [Plakobranchus ocellatus]
MDDPKEDNAGAENPTGDDRSFIDMAIVVKNKFQEPFFEYKHTLTKWPQRILLHALEDCAKEDKHFRFSAAYWGDLGYGITAINKLWPPAEKTYWHISSSLTGSLRFGVSTFIPQNKEVITFNLQSYTNPEDCVASSGQAK